MCNHNSITSVSLDQVPWIVASADRLMNWLIREGKSDRWKTGCQNQPFVYRSSVEFITYESLFVPLWVVPWFQDGIKAFGLLALEYESKINLSKIKFCQDAEKNLWVLLPSGESYTIESFLNGESLEIRFDPECSDFSWDAVDAVGHILSELRPEEFDDFAWFRTNREIFGKQ